MASAVVETRIAFLVHEPSYGVHYVLFGVEYLAYAFVKLFVALGTRAYDLLKLATEFRPLKLAHFALSRVRLSRRNQKPLAFRTELLPISELESLLGEKRPFL